MELEVVWYFVVDLRTMHSAENILDLKKRNSSKDVFCCAGPPIWQENLCNVISRATLALCPKLCQSFHQRKSGQKFKYNLASITGTNNRNIVSNFEYVLVCSSITSIFNYTKVNVFMQVFWRYAYIRRSYRFSILLGVSNGYRRNYHYMLRWCLVNYTGRRREATI